MNYKRLGLAFCIGLRKEAKVVHEVLESAGFEVMSVACKAGRVPKSELGLTKAEHVDATVEVETMCNPVFQAEVANPDFSSVQAASGSVVFGNRLYLRIYVAKILPKMATPGLTFCEHFVKFEGDSIVEYCFVFMYILQNKTKCS